MSGNRLISRHPPGKRKKSPGYPRPGGKTSRNQMQKDRIMQSKDRILAGGSPADIAKSPCWAQANAGKVASMKDQMELRFARRVRAD